MMMVLKATYVDINMTPDGHTCTMSTYCLTVYGRDSQCTLEEEEDEDEEDEEELTLPRYKEVSNLEHRGSR